MYEKRSYKLLVVEKYFLKQLSLLLILLLFLNGIERHANGQRHSRRCAAICSVSIGARDACVK